jgi:putative lipoic acid-binding regulatory protein
MKQGLVIIAGIVVLVVGIIAFYWFEARPPGDEAPVVTPVEVVQEPVVIPEPEPETPPLIVEQKRVAVEPVLEELPLPPLSESDDYAQQNLSGMVGEAAAMQYFVEEALVSRVVATVDAMGSRQVPDNIQAVRGPVGSYAATEDKNPPTVIRNEVGDPVPQYLSDPSNQGRYITYVEMLEALDAEQFAALYQRNYPLFQQAWRELGYTDVEFGDRLVEVIDELLATPEISEPYRLVKPEAVYLFADEELEALSAGQKILLRMGSENSTRVKSKLSEIRQAL